MATGRLEGRATNGHHGAIWEALPVLTYLMGKVEQGRQAWNEKGEWTTPTTGRNRQPSYTPHPMEVAYQNAWGKLTKYYEKTDDANAIYAAAVLLHPSQQKRYFDKHWTGAEAAYKSIMIANVKKVWFDEYRGAEVPETPRTHPIDEIEEFLTGFHNEVVDGDDFFDQFINGNPIAFPQADDVIKWIVKDGNLPRCVRQQALDLLSIPAMSAELERVFSSARLSCTHLRNSLSAESIEVIELLRYWWVRNIIQQERGGGGRLHRKRKAVEVPDFIREGDEEENGP